MAATPIGVGRREPNQQQFAHRRDDLHVHIVRRRHVVETARRIPAAAVDHAEYLPANNDGSGLAPDLD